MFSSTSKPLHQHPPLDEFATMLAELFTGTPETLLRPNHLTKELWTLQELMGRVKKLKLIKSADGCGLVADVFKHIAINFAAKILHLYNDLLSSGHSLSSCRRTLFTTVAKQAALVTAFRPIASIRLFYKIFAYMTLHRIEPCLDSHQPEEQHGFRAGRRLEQHLLTANFFLDKILAANIDKDACFVLKCFLQYFRGQCHSGEHTRKNIRLDLILASHPFFGFEICKCSLIV